jgi:hypothetical protein
VSLSTAQLTAARATVAGFMPDTASVFKRGSVDATTGLASATAGAAVSYACRVDRTLNKRGGESVQHGAVEAMTRYVLVLPWDAVVDESMQATVSGVTYNILEVALGGTQAIETRCLVARSD